MKAWKIILGAIVGTILIITTTGAILYTVAMPSASDEAASIAYCDSLEASQQ